MKRVITIMAFAAELFAQPVMANDDVSISEKARRNFEKEFPGAIYVKWEKIDNTDTYIVRYVYNDQALLSYINDEGSLLATARQVERKSLPLMVNMTLDRRFGSYSILSIEELSMDSNLSYIVTMENEKQLVKIRVNSSGSYYELRKEKKKTKE